MLTLAVFGTVISADGQETLYGFTMDKLDPHQDKGSVKLIQLSCKSEPCYPRWLASLKQMLADATTTAGCEVAFDMAFVERPGDFFDQLPGMVHYGPYPPTLRGYRFVRFRNRLQALRVSKQTPFFVRRVEPLAGPLEDLLPTTWQTHRLTECAMSVLRNPSSRIPPWKMRSLLPQDVIEQILAAPPRPPQ